jgi:hypothetical protein
MLKKHKINRFGLFFRVKIKIGAGPVWPAFYFVVATHTPSHCVGGFSIRQRHFSL